MTKVPFWGLVLFTLLGSMSCFGYAGLATMSSDAATPKASMVRALLPACSP